VGNLIRLAIIPWALMALAQDSGDKTVFRGLITGGQPMVLAVPDFRGNAVPDTVLATFNKVLWSELEDCGQFKLASKSMYPRFVPQQPSDWTGRFPEWVGPPVSAIYVAFGYAAGQNGSLVVRGWLDDARQSQGGAQVLGNTYIGSIDEAGARKTARQYAADIITSLGGTPTLGTHIYFKSDRSGAKEIWVMEADGSNQRQVTHFNFIATFPAVSPDGSKIAFTAWPAPGQSPRIFIYSAGTFRDLHFRNPEASMNGTPSFAPDGRRIFFMSSAKGTQNLFSANLDGSDLRQISSGNTLDAEPKVNPAGNTIAFSSGRSGHVQIYRSSLEGGDTERLSDGTGEAANPCWHPNGRQLAFAWTRGYAPGAFNIFIMDVAGQKPIQLTHDAGKNENPSWAPDGLHLAFTSTRTGQSQIWSMLADGTGLDQLTTQGHNEAPVWGK
jgi:TolB protein